MTEEDCEAIVRERFPEQAVSVWLQGGLFVVTVDEESVARSDLDSAIAWLGRERPKPTSVQPASETVRPPPEQVIRTVYKYRDSPETLAELERLRAELAARSPPPEAEMPEEKPQQLPPDPESARLSDYGPVGSSVPPEIRELMEEGETIAQAKTRITQLLWVEQAELRQLQGKKGENLKREGEIEFLLGLLARLSD